LKRFFTLVWLEHRRNWLWSLPLMGSLLFWAWGIQQVTIRDSGGAFGLRAGLLMSAASIGAAVLCVMVGRIRSETRHGQYQVLLMTPPSGYTHILARFAYAFGVACAYYMAIGMLFWWIVHRAGIDLDPRSLIDLIVALPLYSMLVAVFPLLAYALLLMVFISAHRVSGPGWIPGLVMLSGTPFVLQRLADWNAWVSWTLPGWPVFESIPDNTFDQLAPDAVLTVASADVAYSGLPLEPVFTMLALTLLMLVLAGRIWREVEA
jgi:hypothetical protein